MNRPDYDELTEAKRELEHEDRMEDEAFRKEYDRIMVPLEERMKILNEWLAKGGTGPTPLELAVSIPGMDGKEYLAQFEALREAFDRAEKIRQGWDPGIGRWR